MTKIDKYLSTIHKYINKIIAMENSHSSNRMSFFSYFRKKIFWKGNQPFLIVVYDSNHRLTKKKKGYAEIFSKLTKANVLILNEDKLSVAEQKQIINQSIIKHEIKYIFALYLPAELGEYVFFSKDDQTVGNYIEKTSSLTTFQRIFHSNQVKNEFLYEFPEVSTIEIELGARHQQAFLVYFTTLLKTIPLLSFNNNSTTQIVKIDYRSVSNLPLNRIELSNSALAQYHLTENDYVMIFNPQTGLTNIGIVKPGNVNENEMRISSLLKKSLKITGEIDHLVIHPLHYVKSKKVMLQQIDSISSGNIIVSEDIYRVIEKMNSPMIEFVNGVTSSGLDVRKEEIVLDPLLAPSTIRMNFLQRQFLNYEEPPHMLSKYYYHQYYPQLNEDERAFFEIHYKDEKVHTLKEFEDKQKMKRILTKMNYYQPSIYPASQIKVKKAAIHKRLRQYLLDFFIRDKYIALNVVRPYSTDETNNTIRLTRGVMKTLGVDESDIVEIHYRGRTVAVQVLEFDSLELIKDTNMITSESSINISVGVPAHIRSALGIKQIGKVAVVSRELTYLLKKSLNLQFLPFVAVTFTVLSFSKVSSFIQLLIIIVLLPLASYMSLSPIRERIPKEKRGYNGKKKKHRNAL